MPYYIPGYIKSDLQLPSLPLSGVLLCGGPVPSRASAEQPSSASHPFLLSRAPHIKVTPSHPFHLRNSQIPIPNRHHKPNQEIPTLPADIQNAPLHSNLLRPPPTAVQAVKTAIFAAAAAGRCPGPVNYTECCWSATGTGQFRPGDAANPHIGDVDKMEDTPEVRVETSCQSEEVTRRVVEALKRFLFFIPFLSLFYFLAVSVLFLRPFRSAW